MRRVCLAPALCPLSLGPHFLHLNHCSLSLGLWFPPARCDGLAQAPWHWKEGCKLLQHHSPCLSGSECSLHPHTNSWHSWKGREQRGLMRNSPLTYLGKGWKQINEMLPAHPVLFQIKVITKNQLLLDCFSYHYITGLSETVSNNNTFSQCLHTF